MKMDKYKLKKYILLFTSMALFIISIIFIIKGMGALILNNKESLPIHANNNLLFSLVALFSGLIGALLLSISRLLSEKNCLYNTIRRLALSSSDDVEKSKALTVLNETEEEAKFNDKCIKHLNKKIT